MKIINKCMFCFVVSAIFYTVNTNTVFAWSRGPKAYRTGAPGDKTCNANNCHNSFGLNSGTATFSINAPAVYVPGQTIRIKVSFSNTTGIRHGFEMTAVDDATGKRVGTFKRKNKLDKTTQVIPPGDLRGLKIADKGTYIEHTLAGTKQTSWKVRWKAPIGAESITFYATGNDANGDKSPLNDFIYLARRNIIAQ